VTLLLAAVDGAVGAYLVWYAARRERRDKPAVLVTGVFLLACAAILSVLGLL
jgi:drug/metabolite transporter superfamily protein YnfA